VAQGLVAVDLMTTDIAAAVRGADLIMLVVPSIAHAYSCTRAGAADRRQPADLHQPGHTGGGLHFLHELRCAGYRGPVR
jgi:opine dehydrogenase